jgi:hypothetical protein
MHLSCKQWRPFYRREREHGVRGSAAGARPVSAKEGTRRSGLSADGCGGLQALAGALGGGGVVGSEGDTLGRRRVPVSRPWSGPERAKGQRGMDVGWERGVIGYSYGARAHWGAACHSDCTIAESCPLGVRHKLRKKSKFEFLKFSNWVGHYIGLGF